MEPHWQPPHETLSLIRFSPGPSDRPLHGHAVIREADKTPELDGGMIADEDVDAHAWAGAPRVVTQPFKRQACDASAPHFRLHKQLPQIDVLGLNAVETISDCLSLYLE